MSATTVTTHIPIGTIIWLAVKPLIRLLICLLSGFTITKCDLFPAAAAKTIGQIIINVCFPFLLFSKIVPAFNASNIHFIGPLFLLAVLYHAIGITIAWIIKQFCWVPHRFRYGFLAAGAWSNIGDIPTAVLLGLTSYPPFNSSTDPNIAIAYLSVFLIVFNITIFSCGGHKLVLMDYESPDLDAGQPRALMQIRRMHIFRRLSGIRGTVPPLSTIKRDPEHGLQNTKPVPPSGDQEIRDADVVAEITEVSPRADSPAPTIIDVVEVPKQEKYNDGSTVPNPSRTSKLPSFFINVFKSLLSPPSLTILISIPISLIVPLQALFLPVNHQNIVIPTLPDGEPPLGFFLDAAQFIGAGAVPLGLICLGGALARLHLPTPPDNSPASSSSPSRTARFLNSFKALPLTSITLLALSKLVLIPILGMFIVQSLVSHNIIPEDDKVLRLVCLICACLPTSTTQVYLTQVYSETGGVEWLGAYLVPQYVLMVLSMSVYIGLVLKVLFY